MKAQQPTIARKRAIAPERQRRWRTCGPPSPSSNPAHVRVSCASSLVVAQQYMDWTDMHASGAWRRLSRPSESTSDLRGYVATAESPALASQMAHVRFAFRVPEGPWTLPGLGMRLLGKDVGRTSR